MRIMPRCSSPWPKLPSRTSGAVLNKSGWTGSNRSTTIYRAAFQHLIEVSPTLEKALRLGAALENFLSVRGQYGEWADLLETALDDPAVSPPSAVRAAALKTAGALLMARYGPRRALARYEECLLIARGLDDRSLTSEILTRLAWIRFLQRDYAAAAALIDEGLILARDIADRRWIAGLLVRRGQVLCGTDPDQARADFEQALRLVRTMGNSHRVAYVLGNLGMAELIWSNLDAAKGRLEESRRIHLELRDDEAVVSDLHYLCLTGLLQQNISTAIQLSTEALIRGQTLSNTFALPYSLLCRGAVPQCRPRV